MVDIEKLRERFESMKPFKCVEDIPDVPIVKDNEQYESIVVANLIRCGAIPKTELEVGCRYEGSCRNASEGIWNGKDFDIKRYKFGEWYDSTVNHFQDDDGYDVFVPIRKIENNG